MTPRPATNKKPLRVGGANLEFGQVTYVMGVINLSPESKNTHTVASGIDEAVELARLYREWGATIIDLGAQSSHYDNPTIDASVELARLVPVVDALLTEGFLLSVDTWKPEVARQAIERGVQVINDTGGLVDVEMREVVASSQAAAVAVYVEGDHPHDVGTVDTEPLKAARTADIFRKRLDELATAGIENVIIDPGIALNYRGDYQAYTRLQLEVIRDSRFLHELGRPLLIPIPRKAEDHRVMAYITLALEYGADFIRVHDVEQATDLVALFGRTSPMVLA
jgi:dihydropteroate synthase